MVREQIEARGVRDPKVLAALRHVPRHRFVDARYRALAHGDQPLPIGEGQTISQPYIVALMTELLELRGGERVLEIGTGSGYQAAVLSEIVPEVYTIEILPVLGRSAQTRLRALGYRRIQTQMGDGYFGWKEAAPFDAILVTAAPDHIPPPLILQLKEGGRLVIPVGPPGAVQMLWKITKKADSLELQEVTEVSFVPLTRR